jgi:hypothetical protein
MATPRVALETRSTIRRSPDLGRGRGAEGASRKMELQQNEQRSIFEASYRGE